MKDYGHVVVWLDYYNKHLARSRGRRLGKERCVYDPSIKELAGAAEAAGLEVKETRDDVRFPRRPHVQSGYIVLPKTGPKGRILGKISARMVARRAKQPKKS